MEQLTTRRTNRIERVPLAEQREKMSVEGRDPNYVYRWVNDVDRGQRVARFKRAGYEVVQDEVKVGDPIVDTGLDKTSSVNERVVNRQGERAVLMRQRKDWYEADQKAKQDALKASEQAMQEEGLRKFGELRDSEFSVTRRKA